VEVEIYFFNLPDAMARSTINTNYADEGGSMVNGNAIVPFSKQ